MKKINTKKIVLWVGFGALVLLVLLGLGESKLGLNCSFRINERMDPYAGGFVVGGNGEYQPGLTWDTIEWCEPLAFVLMTFLPILFLSLITYKMREEVFHAWWNFARWFAPVIILVTLFLNNASGGGTLGMDDMFTALILFILYTILVVVSVVKIVRAHKRSVVTK